MDSNVRVGRTRPRLKPAGPLGGVQVRILFRALSRDADELRELFEAARVYVTEVCTEISTAAWRAIQLGLPLQLLGASGSPQR